MRVHRSGIPKFVGRCTICQKPLLGKSYIIQGNDALHYCPECIRTRPRCDSCGHPLPDRYWKLHDGRNHCIRCHKTAIYDPALAHMLFDETVAGIVEQLNLVVTSKLTLRLVDRSDLWQAQHEDQPPPPLEQYRDPGHHRILGLYVHRGNSRVIYMLYGLPRITFRTTLAHEYAHAWQSEQCPYLTDDFLREGFAEWVAFYHLLWLGATKAAHRMLSAHHSYLTALEYLFQLERTMGRAGVIEFIRQSR